MASIAFAAMRQLDQPVMPTINWDAMTSDQLDACQVLRDRAQAAMAR